MEEDYARYMASKRLYDEAARAVQAVLDDEDASRRLGAISGAEAGSVVRVFKSLSAHIVAVWD